VGIGFRSFFLLNSAIVVVAFALFWRWAAARPGETRALAASA
jgi:hypothetical protein